MNAAEDQPPESSNLPVQPAENSNSGSPTGSETPEDGEPHAQEIREVDFSTLSKGASTVLIRFEGTVYTLKRTRNNRLILNK